MKMISLVMVYLVMLLQLLTVISSLRDVAWEDTELTSRLWSICSQHDTDSLIEVLSDQSIVPPPAFVRSKDGRGPLFWAYEYGFDEGIQILEEIGVSPYEEDAYAKTPKELGEENAEVNKKRKESMFGFSGGGSGEFSDDHYGDEDEDYGDVYEDEL